MEGRTRPSETVRTSLSVLAAPVWLPLLLLSGFRTWLLPSELWLAYDLWRRGRYLSSGELRAHARAGRGTIIYDRAYPTGWGERVWWTDEDVLSMAPVPPPRTYEERFGPAEGTFTWHAFDRWVCQAYLDPERGRARWVGAGGGCRDEAEVRRRYPGCAVVESFSGGKSAEEIERAFARVRAENGPRGNLPRPDGDSPSGK